MARAVRRRARRSTSRSCCSATSPRLPGLELVTGVIILPQRQTALVAKQAAEVDLLTAAGSGSASGSAGTPSSTRRSARISPTAAAGWRSRSTCCAGSGPSRSSTFDGPLAPDHGAPGSSRCRCSGRSRSGSAARRAAFRRTAASATAGSRSARSPPTAEAGPLRGGREAGRGPARIGIEWRIDVSSASGRLACRGRGAQAARRDPLRGRDDAWRPRRWLPPPAIQQSAWSSRFSSGCRDGSRRLKDFGSTDRSPPCAPSPRARARPRGPRRERSSPRR